MNVLEIFAVFFGVISVWFAKKKNVYVYPTGLINTSIYVYICFSAKLYADMTINMYYVVMSIYGWVLWSKKTQRQNGTLAITHNTKIENIKSIFFAFISFVLLFFILEKYTDSDVPFLDSITTSLFFVAMWLMAKKKIEHWIFWIVGDIIVIPLFFYKELYFTSFQYIIFTCIAFLGLWEWRKSIKLPY
ncbi:MAG: nicotinamide riboside transporter PnuC [Chitinophagaceae bacterium]|nr:nicotinamide riboside transporter PnuC [Chitinophagaceae bacterium]